MRTWCHLVFGEELFRDCSMPMTSFFTLTNIPAAAVPTSVDLETSAPVDDILARALSCRLP